MTTCATQRETRFGGTNYVLVVDVAGQPKDIIPWKRAVVGIFEGKVTPLLNYTNEDGSPVFIKSPTTSIEKPAVVALTSYYPRSYGLKVSASKYNICLRDNFVCQYTGAKLSRATANIDHVIPKSKGGTWSWDNLVCCDINLNTKKEDKTLKEAGLKLLRQPKKPTRELILTRKIRYSSNRTWIQYLDNREIDVQKPAKLETTKETK